MPGGGIYRAALKCTQTLRYLRTKMMIFLIIYYCQLQFWRVSDLAVTFSHRQIRLLRGSLPKSGPLDFATKNAFALFFVGEEALVGVY